MVSTKLLLAVAILSESNFSGICRNDNGSGGRSLMRFKLLARLELACWVCCHITGPAGRCGGCWKWNPEFTGNPVKGIGMGFCCEKRPLGGVFCNSIGYPGVGHWELCACPIGTCMGIVIGGSGVGMGGSGVVGSNVGGWKVVGGPAAHFGLGASPPPHA